MNNKTFGQLVKENREALGLSQEELAAKTGLSQGSISRIENDAQKNLLEKTKCSILQALGIDSISVPEKRSTSIPVISWVHAGLFCECSDIWPPGVSGEGEPVYSYAATGPNAFGLRIEGDSMAPRFLPGDIAIVDPAIHCDNGAPRVVCVNGEVSLKLFWDRENEIVLRPLNDHYPEIIIKKDSKVDFRVIGKVVDIRPKL